MVRPNGLFDSFDNLDQISPEAIASWLKPVPGLVQIENYLANKILYPQALPLTQHDMQVDLAILREVLKMNKAIALKTSALLGDNPFLNTTLRKILIPVRFLNFVPDLTSLTLSFIDAFLLDRKREDYFSDLWTIVLTDNIDEVVGSVLLPQFDDNSGMMNLKLYGKDYEVRPGNFVVIPCPKERCAIAYNLKKGTVLGKKESAVEVYGGKLGLIVDGRGV